jgi:hypothetical protein
MTLMIMVTIGEKLLKIRRYLKVLNICISRRMIKHNLFSKLKGF